MAQAAAREQLMIDFKGDEEKVEEAMADIFGSKWTGGGTFNMETGELMEKQSPELVSDSDDETEEGKAAGGGGGMAEYLDTAVFYFAPQVQHIGKPMAMSYDEFTNYVKKHGAGYEVLGQSPVRPYYDFEEYYDTKEEMLAARLPKLRMCRDTLLSLWTKKGYWTEQQIEIHASDACGYDNVKSRWKVSYHFVVSAGIAYESGTALKHDGGVPGIFDQQPYSKLGGQQKWRAPLASKEGQDRALKPIDIETGEVEYAGADPRLWVWAHSPQVVYGCEVKKVVAPRTTKRAAVKIAPLSTEEREWIRRALMALDVKHADVFKDWNDVMFFLAHVQDDSGTDMMDIAREFSAKSVKYKEYVNEDIERKFRDADNPNADRVGLGTVIRWLDADGSEGGKKKRQQLMAAKPESLMRLDDPKGWAEVKGERGTGT